MALGLVQLWSSLWHIEIADYKTLHAQPDAQLVTKEFIYCNLYLNKNSKKIRTKG